MVFLVGLGVVAWALRSAVETVILPRSSQNTLARLVFRTTGTVFRFLANERREFDTRDRIMALCAPVSLLLLPAVWVATNLLGYLAMFWALGRTIADAFFVSGSSFLTLGFAPVDTELKGFWRSPKRLSDLESLLCSFLFCLRSTQPSPAARRRSLCSKREPAHLPTPSSF